MQKEMDKCSVCGKTIEDRLLFPIELLRQEIFDLLIKDHPQISEDGEICHDDLDSYFGIWAGLELEKSKQSSNVRRVIVDSFKSDTLISRNAFLDNEKNLSFGDRLADDITSFGGSWSFIIYFGIFIFVWAVINTTYILKNPVDPFPYILLNLLLSCLAAIQAPIILMSQNRQSARDRAQAEHEYQVNLKSEIEIQFLNDKVDYFTKKMWEKLCDIEDRMAIESNASTDRSEAKPSSFSNPVDAD